MPIPLFPFLFRRRKKKPAPAPTPHTAPNSEEAALGRTDIVRRHFYNERGFQTYGSFFAHWNGYISAGHVLKAAGELLPPFARGPVETWPDGLDAALMGCRLPDMPPPAPRGGQDIICIGYPAGSNAPALRRGKVYLQRPNAPGTWIAHIISPDEPVVTGMSGGAVVDAHTNEPIGIIITRNSPANLNNDRDPDESCDFIDLHSVWQAMNADTLYA